MLWNRIREIIRKMFGMNTTIEQTLHITPAISTKMIDAIDRWSAMYEDRAEWLHEPSYNDHSLVASLGLPAFIASEKARMATLELQSEITAPINTEEKPNPNYFPPHVDPSTGSVVASYEPKTVIEETPKSPTERAEYMNEQYQRKLLPKLRTQLELGIAKGSLIIKPYVVIHRLSDVSGVSADATTDSTNEVKKVYSIEYDFVQADCFYPFSFDSNGNLKEVAFIQYKVDKDVTYTRLEYHKLNHNNVTIENRAFESYNNEMADNIAVGASLGREIPLTKVAEWANLPKKATINNVDRLMFGYFKMPEANTIDPHSPLGISGFARAESLIEQADKQYSRLLWEYEGGELAIDIDRDALTDVKDFKGQSHSVMGHLQQRLYRPIDLGESNTYQPYAPTLRDASIINGLNNLLMRIEDVCALSRGTISDVAAEARTATELKILKQRSYSSNAEIQTALENALKDVVYAMDVYCTIYDIVGDTPRGKDGKIDTSKMGLYDVSFTWDDSIIVDVDTELNKRILLMQNGLSSKLETRMWYFGESKRQAQDALLKIQEESQLAIEQNMIASQMMAQDLNQGEGQEQNEGNGNEGKGQQANQENPKQEQNIEQQEEQTKQNYQKLQQQALTQK